MKTRCLHSLEQDSLDWVKHPQLVGAGGFLSQ